MPSEKILEHKKSLVNSLKQDIDGANAGVLVDYKGINVEDDTKLRAELREAGVSYKVIKNSLLKRAFEGTDYAGLEDCLKGTTAFALGTEEDSLAPARILNKYAEASGDAFSIKGGFLDGHVVPASEIAQLAKLPGKEGLLTMLVSALIGPVRGLAVALNAVAEQGGDSAETAEASE